MNFKSNKGISLVEVLVATAILAIVMPMIASILISSIQDYVSGTNYVNQQDQINNIYQRIRNAHERCREITINRVADSTRAAGSTLPMNMLDSLELKYSNTNHKGDAFDTDLPLDEEWWFEDVPAKDEDILHVTNSESGIPVIVNMLENVNVRDKDTLSSAHPKSGIYCSNIGGIKVWIEIWFNDINTEFFKSRNYGAPIVIFFDITNKQFNDERKF